MRWVVFDYGEVISRRTAALPSLAAVLGAPPEDFEEVYFAERNAYDRGCGDLPYWRAVGKRLGVRIDAALVERLTGADVAGWLETAPGVVELLDELHSDGVPLALLSNAPSSFGRAAEQQPWARVFKHLLFSGDLQIAKPDAAIWRVLLDTLNAPPAECLFFDDREENVRGARRAGLHAELWQGPDHAREVLRAHGVLL